MYAFGCVVVGFPLLLSSLRPPDTLHPFSHTFFFERQRAHSSTPNSLCQTTAHRMPRARRFFKCVFSCLQSPHSNGDGSYMQYVNLNIDSKWTIWWRRKCPRKKQTRFTYKNLLFMRIVFIHKRTHRRPRTHADRMDMNEFAYMRTVIFSRSIYLCFFSICPELTLWRLVCAAHTVDSQPPNKWIHIVHRYSACVLVNVGVLCLCAVAWCTGDRACMRTDSNVCEWHCVHPTSYSSPIIYFFARFGKCVIGKRQCWRWRPYASL